MAEPAMLAEAYARIEELSESLSALEQLAREDRGWDRLISATNHDMTAEGRRRVSDLCEVMTVANPLIKRGFLLRHSYVWGAGHTVSVTQSEADGSGTVNAALQAVLDDPRNSASLNSEEARQNLERWLYTHGAVVLMCDTDEKTGAVVVRQVDPDNLTDHITDPEDARTVRYWRRDYHVRAIRKDGTPGASKRVTIWHPDVDYHPTGADRLDMIGGKPVRWDQPLIVRSVNAPASEGWAWGFGDAYAAVPWARMSKEFLEAWFTLMQALSRYAWRTSTKGRNARTVAAAARTAPLVPNNPAGAGAHVVMDQDTSLEAVPKTGATIDASSALPLQQFVAAALDVPLTMLLGDPGITGARSVAETLDQPMELAMGARRRFWGEIFTRLGQHVIDAAVIAKRIPGSVVTANGRRIVTLPEGWSRTIEVNWPEFDSLPTDVLLRAIRDADGLDVLPRNLIARLALQALKVPDLDEWLERIQDENLLGAS